MRKFALFLQRWYAMFKPLKITRDAEQECYATGRFTTRLAVIDEQLLVRFFEIGFFAFTTIEGKMTLDICNALWNIV